MERRLQNVHTTTPGVPAFGGGGSGGGGSPRFRSSYDTGRRGAEFSNPREVQEFANIMMKPATSSRDTRLRQTVGQTRPGRYKEQGEIGPPKYEMKPRLPWGTAMKGVVEAFQDLDNSWYIAQAQAIGQGWTRVSCGFTHPNLCNYTGNTNSLCGALVLGCSSITVGNMSGNVNGAIQEWRSAAGNPAFGTRLDASWIKTPSAVLPFPTVARAAFKFNVPAVDPEQTKKAILRNMAISLANKTHPNPYSRINADGRFKQATSKRPATEYVFANPLKLAAAYVAGVPPYPPKPVVHADVPDGRAKVRSVPKSVVNAIKLMHTATELQDFFESLFDALPAAAKKGYTRGDFIEMIQAVVANWYMFADPTVMNAAIENLVVNHIEDKVIGNLFGASWDTGVRTFDSSYNTSGWLAETSNAGNREDPATGTGGTVTRY